MSEKRFQAKIVKVIDVTCYGSKDFTACVSIQGYSTPSDWVDEPKFINFSEVKNWFGVTEKGYSVKYALEKGAVIEFSFSPVFKQCLENIKFLPYKDELGRRLL